MHAVKIGMHAEKNIKNPLFFSECPQNREGVGSPRIVIFYAFPSELLSTIPVLFPRVALHNKTADVYPILLQQEGREGGGGESSSAFRSLDNL